MEVEMEEEWSDLRATSRLVLRRPESAELRDVAAFLGDAMADNPNHVGAYGPDPGARAGRHAVVMRALLARRRAGPMLAAFDGAEVVGFIAATPWPACRPTAAELARALPALALLGPSSLVRVLAWQNAWSKLHPTTPHLHVGPLAVREDWRRRGVGRTLLGASLDGCRRAGYPTAAYLETDSQENVAFYAMSGFAATAEAIVLGRRNWFMERPAERR